MKLYILRDNQTGWDDTLAVIVRAKDPTQARRLASEEVPGDNKDKFADPEKTTCEQVRLDGTPGVVIADTSWG